VPFVERGRTRSYVGLCAKSNALDTIAVFESRQIAKQRVLENRHEVALEENACRLAACVFKNIDIVWRRRVARHTSARQGQRVCHGWKWPTTPPPPNRADVDRVVGSHCVEVVPCWKAALNQLIGAAEILVRRLPHRHQYNPLASRGRLRRPLHDINNFCDRVESGDRDAATCLETFSVGMRMRIEQPRQHRSACEVDDLGRWRSIFEEQFVVADGHDMTRSNRDGLSQS
jgi:hypothetical protein